VRPRRSRPNDGGWPKLFKAKVLSSRGFVPGVKPLRPPPRIVVRSLEVEVVDILAHLAAETAGLVMQGALDDKDSAPHRPVGLDP
jgi:hypothetical protein